MAFTVPKITIPGLNEAPCGLDPKIEELNAIKSKAAGALDSLTSSAGGIFDSIATLGSSISSSISEVTAKLNKNLLGDLPTIGLKLQDEFHSAINSFGTGQSVDALTKLKEIEKQFPQFDIQKALNGAAGILPTGSIPPNATELIKGDLTKVLSSLGSAIPKITTLDKNLSIGATDLLSSAKTTVSSALANLNSGSGTTADLKGAMKFANSAVKSAQSELSKLGGAFNSVSPTVDSALESLVSSGNNLITGVSKVPKFDICNAVPNQQVVNGVVEELPIPPVKPTVNSEPPTPPTPAPTPVTPVLDDRFSFPWWTVEMRDEIQTLTAPKNDDGVYKKKTHYIPLDTNWPDSYEKAIKILESPKKTISDYVSLNFSDLSTQQMQYLIATQKHINTIQRELYSMDNFYRYRVKNNLIDRLE